MRRIRSFAIALTLLSALSASPAWAELRQFNALLDPAQELSCALASSAAGAGSFLLDDKGAGLGPHPYTLNLTFGTNSPTFNNGLLSQGAELFSHIHGPAAPGASAGIQITLPNGTPKNMSGTITDTQRTQLLGGLWYFNIHSTNCSGGEIRGQLIEVTAVPALPGTMPLALGAALALLLATGLALRGERT